MHCSNREPVANNSMLAVPEAKKPAFVATPAY
jgi:hypothetical protein